MGLFVKKKRAETPTVTLAEPTPRDFLEKRLREDGVEYVIESGQSDASMAVWYRGFDDLPCFRIETTQLFSNPNCVYTYDRREWRQNTFPPGTLGYIDISVTDSYEVCLSAMAPGDNILDENVLQRKMDTINALLAQEVGLFAKSKCLKDIKFPNAAVGECPYIIFGGRNSGFTYSVKPGAQSAEYVFNLIQLFALVVHRTFGAIYKPYASLPSARVRPRFQGATLQ